MDIMRKTPTTSTGARRRFLWICAASLLPVIAALAQEPPRARAPALTHAGQAHESVAKKSLDVPEKADVISIQSHCRTDSSSNNEPNGCAVSVKRQEFDALIQALDPKMDAASRQSLAAEYARLLIMASEARRRGIDRSSVSETLLKYTALQVLAAQLVRDITANARPVSDEEVNAYFQNHARDYQEVVVSRIVVPAPPQRSKHRSLEPAALARAMRTRAIQGEDFTALQREISGIPSGGPEPNVRIGPLPCLALPETDRPTCDLKEGEISPVFTDKLGYFIYRLESTHNRRPDEVGDEIRAMLERQRVQREIETVRTPASLELDERYFGKLPSPDLAAAHGMHFPPAKNSTPAGEAHAHPH
jgi:hypothetical protein